MAEVGVVAEESGRKEDGEQADKGTKPGPSPFPQGETFQYRRLPIFDNVAETEEGQGAHGGVLCSQPIGP